MLKLGQVINPHAVSVLNKLGSTGMNVDERVAYRKLLKFAEPALKEWQDLLSNFKEKIESKDQETLESLGNHWLKETEAAKLPSSIVGKVEVLSPNEETALLELCEAA
jgi:hypothetical protein